MNTETSFELTIKSRNATGKGNSRRIRGKGSVPGVIYGGGADPKTISLNHDQLINQMENDAFYTSILKLNLDNTSESVVVKNVHRHPVKRKILHMDFQRILEDQKISLNVPIRFLGEDVAIGVKMQGGEISKLLNDIEVSCLPKNLPEYLEIDLSNLELNQSLYVSDLKLPEGVELNTIMIEQNNAVVSINPPRREEEEIIEDDVVQETDDSESPADEDTPDNETSSE